MTQIGQGERLTMRERALQELADQKFALDQHAIAAGWPMRDFSPRNS